AFAAAVIVQEERPAKFSKFGNEADQFFLLVEVVEDKHPRRLVVGANAKEADLDSVGAILRSQFDADILPLFLAVFPLDMDAILRERLQYSKNLIGSRKRSRADIGRHRNTLVFEPFSRVGS